MAGIAFMAAQVHGAIDRDRLIGVDLDLALIAALVIIVGAPALMIDESEREVLALRQRDVREGAAAALIDGRVHDRFQPRTRDNVAIAKSFDARGKVA